MIPIFDEEVKLICAGGLECPLAFAAVEQIRSADIWRKFVDRYRFHADCDNGWRGEFWGKAMRGACLIQNYYHSAEYKAIIEQTVDDLLSCAESDGCISSYPPKKRFCAWDIWCRKYVMLGLIYYLNFVCDDPVRRCTVLKALCAHADCIISSVGKGKIEIYDASTHWQGINSSSILEPFVILYKLTEKPEYLSFCKYIVDSGMASGFDLYKTAKEGKLYPYQYPVTKAYEMMSCFEGILEYYTVTKEREYLDTVVDYAHKIAESDVTVIGSCGCTHELFDDSARRQTYTGYSGIMQETCVTVTWMKLCGKLLHLTGDSFYADQMEKSYCNAYLGAHNFEHNKSLGGLPYDSYSPLLPGVRSQKTGGRMVIDENGGIYGCCAAIASVGGALFADSAVSYDGECTVINFFDNIKAIVNGVEITVETEYPSCGDIKITAEKPMNIKIRIPKWCTDFEISQPYEYDGGYVRVKNAVCVALKLQMNAVLHRADGYGTDEESYKYAYITKGPVLFALDSRLSGSAGMTSPIKFTSGISSSDTPTAHRACISCETDKGTLQLIDYASAGADWDNKTVVSAFIKIK